MVIPVTVAPRVRARKRVVPPTPQPTSRMRRGLLLLLPRVAWVVVVVLLASSGMGRLEMVRRRRMRLSWAVSLVSDALEASVGQ
jgi:hypothetical protein